MSETAELVKRLRKEADDWDEHWVSHSFPPFLRLVADRLEALQAQVERVTTVLERFVRQDELIERGPGVFYGALADVVAEAKVLLSEAQLSRLSKPSPGAIELLRKWMHQFQGMRETLAIYGETWRFLKDYDVSKPSPSVSEEELARVIYMASIGQELPLWEKLTDLRRDWYLKIARAVLSQLHLKSGTGGEWQPIETAPKDGTVLFTDGETRWFSSLETDAELTDVRKWIGWEKVATHWMPLPPPPGEKQALGGMCSKFEHDASSVKTSQAIGCADEGGSDGL